MTSSIARENAMIPSGPYRCPISSRSCSISRFFSRSFTALNTAARSCGIPTGFSRKSEAPARIASTAL